MDLNLNRIEVGTISIMTVDYSFTRKLNDYYLRYTEVRCVPEAEVILGVLNVSYLESNRLESKRQGGKVPFG